MSRRPLRGIASSSGIPPRTGVVHVRRDVVRVERLNVAAVGRIDGVDETREHVAVTARPCLSPGMSFTSIVPALSGRKTCA